MRTERERERESSLVDDEKKQLTKDDDEKEKEIDMNDSQRRYTNVYTKNKHTKSCCGGNGD